MGACARKFCNDFSPNLTQKCQFHFSCLRLSSQRDIEMTLHGWTKVPAQPAHTVFGTEGVWKHAESRTGLRKLWHESGIELLMMIHLDVSEHIHICTPSDNILLTFLPLWPIFKLLPVTRRVRNIKWYKVCLLGFLEVVLLFFGFFSLALLFKLSLNW